MTRGASTIGCAPRVRRAQVRRAMAAALALASLGLAAVPVAANSCAEGCRAQHNQCRMQTKGSPSCDAALTQCLAGCKK